MRSALLSATLLAALVAGAVNGDSPESWDSFRAEMDATCRALATAQAGEGEAAVERLRTLGAASWSETLRSAKEIGEVDIQACSLSMDLLDITEADLDPLVDGVEGVTAFWSSAETGQVLFI